MERSYGTFQRSVWLPFTVSPDQIQAEFNNGVLTVTLPKTKAQERSHRIQIRGTQPGLQNQERSATAQEKRSKGGAGDKAA
jgi:HSP20 family protein